MVRFKDREMARSSFNPRPSTRIPSFADLTMKFASTVLTGSICVFWGRVNLKGGVD